MKLHSDATTGLNTVTAYGAGFIEVNRHRFEGTVAFAPEGEIRAWSIQSIHDLTLAPLRALAGLPEPASDPMALLNDTPPKPGPDQAEVLLIGTGNRQHFLPAQLTQPLLRAGVGVETMDTQAAARTYNILMAEGRKVVVLLLPCRADPEGLPS